MSESTSVTSNGYPVFPERMEYIDGYDPVSLEAPHSSLLRSSTWVGMGLALASLAGFGTVIFAFGANSVGSQEHWTTYLWIGAIAAVVMVVAAFLLIHSGRAAYRQYRAETGRVN